MTLDALNFTAQRINCWMTRDILKVVAHSQTTMAISFHPVCPLFCRTNVLIIRLLQGLSISCPVWCRMCEGLRGYVSPCRHFPNQVWKKIWGMVVPSTRSCWFPFPTSIYLLTHVDNIFFEGPLNADKKIPSFSVCLLLKEIEFLDGMKFFHLTRFSCRFRTTHTTFVILYIVAVRGTVYSHSSFLRKILYINICIFMYVYVNA